MKLTEYKSDWRHCFIDEQGRKQGENKSWHSSGRQGEICHFRDNELHGEFKSWHKNGQQRVICHYQDGKFHGEFKGWDRSGKLIQHTFDMNDKEIINFKKNPELYPSTPEEKTMFVLKYGSAPFIGEDE